MPKRLSKIERMDRDRQAAALGLSGAPWGQVARQLDFANASGAWKAAQRALKRQETDELGPALDLELARLDAMLFAIWRPITAGHLGAIDRGLNIARHRARLLGLEAPEKVDASGAPFVVHLAMPEPDKTIVPELE